MPPKMTVAIAADHAGFPLKEAIKAHFAARVDFLDLGTNSPESCNYADYGHAMGRALTEAKASLGIIICGTGTGIAIAANRHKGIRAAVCTDVTMARLSRLHNDANVLSLGARIVGQQVALDCIEVFLNTDFEGGRHAARVESLDR